MTLPRRSLLVVLGGTLAGGTWWELARSNPRNNDETLNRSQRVLRFAGRAMGAPVRLTIVHESTEVAQEAANASFQELERIEQVFSLYRPTSQVCRLNHQGVLPDPDPDLVAVLRYAQELSRQSQGAFDVTVQPLWSAYAQSFERQSELPPIELAARRKLVDWRRLKVDDHEVRCEQPGMAITLNGVAQGFAADRVARVLADHGVTQALVDSGELAALGNGRTGAPWSVGIRHPRRADEFLTLASLSSRCLSTSGDYATSFSDDLRHHHLFDPRTGRSPDELASVSIAAPTALAADGLSTTVFVAGVERGLALLASLPGVDGLLVRKDGSQLHTPGFPELVRG